MPKLYEFESLKQLERCTKDVESVSKPAQKLSGNWTTLSKPPDNAITYRRVAVSHKIKVKNYFEHWIVNDSGDIGLCYYAPVSCMGSEDIRFILFPQGIAAGAVEYEAPLLEMFICD